MLTRGSALPENPTATWVVSVALRRVDGAVLMQRRRLDRAHGGLWEFPGGKVEPGESAEEACVRELAEELGVEIDTAVLDVVGFASDPARRLVILLYTAARWRGEPRCLDGEEIGWFAPGDLARLAMPPLDYPLARALCLHISGLPSSGAGPKGASPARP